MMNITTLINTIEALAPEMEATVNMVQKGNTTLTGISIGYGPIRPTVYMEHFEKEYGDNYLVVANEMIETCKHAMESAIRKSIDVDKITTWNYAQTHLKLCISPKGTNTDCVVYPYLDLELYVRVVVNENASYKVKMEMLKPWNITTKQLLNAAMDCTKPMYEMKSMAELLYEMTGNENYLEMPVDSITATTKDRLNGASIIYCKDILKFIADSLEDDVMILPSSIHEVLLRPASEMNLEECSKMVAEINENEVEPEEVLSDHAYIFHRDTMEITW